MNNWAFSCVLCHPSTNQRSSSTGICNTCKGFVTASMHIHLLRWLERCWKQKKADENVCNDLTNMFWILCNCQICFFISSQVLLFLVLFFYKEKHFALHIIWLRVWKYICDTYQLVMGTPPKLNFVPFVMPIFDWPLTHKKLSILWCTSPLLLQKIGKKKHLIVLVSQFTSLIDFHNLLRWLLSPQKKLDCFFTTLT